MIALPLVSLALIVTGLHFRGLAWRRCVLFSALLIGIWLVVSTEFLSLFHAITFFGISLVWSIFALLALFYLRFGFRSVRPIETSGPQSESISSRWDRSAIGLTAILVAIVGLTALVSAPNTWDAMEYHLPRVIQWAGHRSVQFYPTIDRQQLSMPPFSEYAMLHAYVLAGSDRFVSLVQWLGYLGSILAISLIVAELGGSRRAQVTAIVLSATVLTALLAASGAKNDNVLTFWISTTVYLLLLWKRNQSWFLFLSIGAATSLAVFSKGTTYVLLPPLFLACFLIWQPKARLQFLARLPVLALILLSISGPLWVRNYHMSGSPLGLPYFDGVGPVQDRLFANSPRGAAQAVAGVLRNVSVNLSVPSHRVNAVSTRLFSALMRRIGVDPNDPGQTFRGQTGGLHPFDIHFAYRDEILVANQWDFILFIAACILYLRHHKRIGAEPGWLALGIIGSFVLFSVLLRWGPWNGRYQMPVFVLACAFIAFVFDRTVSPLATRILMFSLLLVCLPIAAMNIMRPWFSLRGFSQTLFKLPHDETYFLDNHREFASSFIAAAHDPTVHSCHRIGLDAALFRFEYPMMALILRDDPTAHFEYVAVNNPTVRYADPSAGSPCAIVCLGCAGSTDKMSLYSTNSHAATYGRIVIFSNGGKPAAISGLADSTPPAR
jgi:Dolichyl-phosphate-mannose-protein mannosyltransferase